jgi:hypothetical protein
VISRIESISGAWGRFQMLVKVNPVVMMFWTCWIEATRPFLGARFQDDQEGVEPQAINGSRPSSSYSS